jgi:hypothetical protein
MACQIGRTNGGSDRVEGGGTDKVRLPGQSATADRQLVEGATVARPQLLLAAHFGEPERDNLPAVPCAPPAASSHRDGPQPQGTSDFSSHHLRHTEE